PDRRGDRRRDRAAGRVPPGRERRRRTRGSPDCRTAVTANGEFVLDTSRMRAFVADVQAALRSASSPAKACDAIRPRFADLLADPDWLPQEFQVGAPESGMGGGIAQWLLYRANDGSLSLFSLVVPSGSETPVHDHLAWGLVGLYRGIQEEEVYAQKNGEL